MDEIEVEPADVRAILGKCDEFRKRKPRPSHEEQLYVEGIVDALGWILGLYDEPELP